MNGVRNALVLIAIAAQVEAASRVSFDDLVANLKSPNAATRQEAAAALGKSRRREAVTPLAAVVRDPDPKVRLEVVRALRELREMAAVPALVTAMGDEEPAVRQESMLVVVELHTDTDRASTMGRFLQMFSDDYATQWPPPQVPVDASVLRALTVALRDDDKTIREQAALSLGVLGGRGSLKELGLAVMDPDPAVRGAAAVAIAKLGRTADGAALIPLVSDESPSVRNRALYALGELKVKEAGPALRELFEANRRKEAGVRALATLSRIADPAQADLFKELVQDPDPERKRLAVEGLGRVADASFLPAFKKDYQRERNEEVRLAYNFALTTLGDKAFVDSIVLTLPSKTLGNRCRDYILELGKAILPELYPYLNDPDAGVRGALCDLLAQLGDGETVSRLEPLVNDPSADVADRANRAIQRLRREAGTSRS